MSIYLPHSYYKLSIYLSATLHTSTPDYGIIIKQLYTVVLETILYIFSR